MEGPFYIKRKVEGRRISEKKLKKLKDKRK